MPLYAVTVKITIAAANQGEAVGEIEKRVRARGTAEDIPARVVETMNVKEL